MRTIDYLENYFNGDDEYTQKFEAFHTKRRNRNKMRSGEDAADRKPTRKQRHHNRSETEFGERYTNE